MMIKYLDPEGESMDNEMEAGFMQGYMKTVCRAEPKWFEWIKETVI